MRIDDQLMVLKNSTNVNVAQLSFNHFKRFHNSVSSLFDKHSIAGGPGESSIKELSITPLLYFCITGDNSFRVTISWCEYFFWMFNFFVA